MTQRDESTQVRILTPTFRVDGQISLLPGARLTDYVRAANVFIAVTDAVISDHHGVVLFRASFLDVAIASIELILPSDAVIAG